MTAEMCERKIFCHTFSECTMHRRTEQCELPTYTMVANHTNELADKTPKEKKQTK